MGYYTRCYTSPEGHLTRFPCTTEHRTTARIQRKALRFERRNPSVRCADRRRRGSCAAPSGGHPCHPPTALLPPAPLMSMTPSPSCRSPPLVCGCIHPHMQTPTRHSPTCITPSPPSFICCIVAAPRLPFLPPSFPRGMWRTTWQQPPPSPLPDRRGYRTHGRARPQFMCMPTSGRIH